MKQKLKIETFQNQRKVRLDVRIQEVRLSISEQFFELNMLDRTVINLCFRTEFFEYAR